jgi:hypothetical protein
LELGDNKVFTQGFLYRGYREQSFNPDRCYDLNEYFFEQPTPMGKLLNDCLVHSINYALRFPYFVDREQVGRLVMLKQNMTQEKMAADKKRGGVTMSAFKDFFLKDGKSFSAKLFAHFEIQNKEKPGAEIYEWV